MDPSATTTPPDEEDEDDAGEDEAATDCADDGDDRAGGDGRGVVDVARAGARHPVPIGAVAVERSDGGSGEAGAGRSAPSATGGARASGAAVVVARLAQRDWQSSCAEEDHEEEVEDLHCFIFLERFFCNWCVTLEGV